MTETLSDKISEFQSVYGLNNHDDVHHEAIHAMTGIGISAADEMRLAVLQGVLDRDKNYGFPDAAPEDSSRNLYRGIVNICDEIRRYPKGYSKLHTAESAALEMRRVRALDPDEISALRSLGKHIQDKFIQLYDKTFGSMRSKEILNTLFKDVDFVTRAQDIKARYDRPENNWLERSICDMFRAEAAQKGMDPKKIPAAGQSWIRSAP